MARVDEDPLAARSATPTASGWRDRATLLVRPALRTATALFPGLIGRTARPTVAGMPERPRNPAAAAHVWVDELVLAMFELVQEPPTQADWERIAFEVDEAVPFYRCQGWVDDPISYHDQPAAPDASPVALRVWNRRIEQLSFRSGWEPKAGEPGAVRWLSQMENRDAYVWLLRHPGGQPRPWIVAVHGTGFGRPDGDMWALRAEHLHRELGANIAMPVMPLHGRRRPPGSPRGAMVPTPDVLDNVHALAQATWDVRRLIAWIRMQEPTAIGITGMSLGGHIAAMVASLEPLDCVVAGIPVVDFPGVFRRAMRTVDGGPGLHRPYQALGDGPDLLHRIVNPLCLDPATDPSRRFIYAGLHDRMAYAPEQAARLFEHWGQPETHWYAGGHLAQLANRGITQFVNRAFAKSGVSTGRVVGTPRG